MDSDIYNLYNLNIIDLNELITKKISIQINNFLYENNLISLSEKSRDYNKIFNHFFIKNILETLNLEYNNIFLYKNDEKYDIYITKIFNLLKLNIFYIPEIPFLIDNNTIYKLKCLVENKKPINLKKVNEFCEKNSLTYLKDKIKNNHKTKLILHK